jgi:CheY-like chemotaxis protein
MLVDALMPGKTGYEVCEEIRKNPALCTIPILLLTGAFEPFDEDKARKSGADDFISKPFESQHLIGKVKNLLASGSAFTAPSIAQFQPEALPPSVEPIPFELPPMPSDTAPPVADELWGAFQAEELKEAETLEFAEEADEEAGDILTVAPERFIPTPVGPPELDEETANMFKPSWEPVEEQTFSFEDTGETSILPKGEDYSFGESQAESPIIPAVQVPTAEVPFAAVVSPAAEPAMAPVAGTTAALTEDQLRTALTSASREMIEKIVWEVVPDLAEAIIREEIRKLKEGFGA